MRQGSTPRALHVLRRALRSATVALAVAGAALTPTPAAALEAAAVPTRPTPRREAKPAARKSTKARPTRTVRRSKRPATRAASARTTRRAGDVLRRKPVTRAPRLLAARSREPELGDVPTFVLPDLATLLPGFGGAATAADSATPLVATVAAAPAPSGASRGAFTELGRSAGALLDRMVTRARSQLGTRYVLGGENPGISLDCSSFARYAMEALGIALPRTAAQQARVGQAVPRDRKALRPGDLLTFGTRRTVDHVGIYLGEGRFIHASVKSGRVIETTIDRNGQLFRKWQGARRLIASDDSVGTVGG